MKKKLIFILIKYLHSTAFFRCISAFSMPYAVLPLAFVDISVSVGVFSLTVLQIVLVFSIIFSSSFLKSSKSDNFIDDSILRFDCGAFHFNRAQVYLVSRHIPGRTQRWRWHSCFAVQKCFIKFWAIKKPEIQEIDVKVKVSGWLCLD